MKTYEEMRYLCTINDREGLFVCYDFNMCDVGEMIDFLGECEIWDDFSAAMMDYLVEVFGIETSDDDELDDLFDKVIKAYEREFEER